MPQQEERREAWVMFMAAAMSDPHYRKELSVDANIGIDIVASHADLALSEYDKRFSE